MPFPTNSVLDAFGRANENPLANGTWGGNIFGGTAACKLDTNEATASAPFSSSYWSGQTFGPNVEVFQSLEVISQNIGLAWRLTNIGASVNGYECIYVPGTSVVQIYKITAGSEGQIGADISQAFSVGDWIGAEHIGSAITIYRRVSGVWSAIGTRTEGTFNTAGYIGMSIDSGSYVDNFGGGTVVSSGGVQRRGGSLAGGMSESAGGMSMAPRIHVPRKSFFLPPVRMTRGRGLSLHP
jgi:hypothetical protein